MATYKIHIVEKLSDVLEETMRQDLVDYESEHGVDVNYHKFSLVMKNDDGRVVSILNAYTAYAEVYIEDIWVAGDYRRKGLGRKLLLQLEENFKGRGFNNMNLVTSAFQAPGFYKKCGFTAEFVRENHYNPGLTKTFFVKYFEGEDQTQGVLPRKADN